MRTNMLAVMLHIDSATEVPGQRRSPEHLDSDWSWLEGEVSASALAGEGRGLEQIPMLDEIWDKLV